MRTHPLAILKVELVINFAEAWNSLASHVNYLIRATSKPVLNRVCRKLQVSRIQKIAETVERLVITESRRKVRVCAGERRGLKPILLQHGRDSVLVRGYSQHIPAKSQWITGCEDRWQRVIGWSTGRNGVPENEALFGERIQKWRRRALVPHESNMVGAEAIHRDQNQRTCSLGHKAS